MGTSLFFESQYFMGGQDSRVIADFRLPIADLVFGLWCLAFGLSLFWIRDFQQLGDKGQSAIDNRKSAMLKGFRGHQLSHRRLNGNDHSCGSHFGVWQHDSFHFLATGTGGGSRQGFV